MNSQLYILLQKQLDGKLTVLSVRETRHSTDVCDDEAVYVMKLCMR